MARPLLLLHLVQFNMVSCNRLVISGLLLDIYRALTLQFWTIDCIIKPDSYCSSMEYHDVARLYRTNAAIAALRKEWLPLAIAFLHYVFKQKHEVLLPQDIFREKLDLFLEHVNASLSEDDAYRHEANHYIDRWSRDDDLIRIRTREEGYVIQLSPHAERLIGWFEEMLSQNMIGTESRLRNILSLLDDVVSRSTEDIATRLAQLYERREQLDAEIERIETTQEVDGLSDVQIRERLDHISGMAGQLLRDFSLVEERFRDIAASIQQAQLDPAMRRGDILGAALDADEQLEQSDEGQSFRAFYELLTHPEQRATFDNLLGTVFESPRLSRYAADNNVLRRLTSHLLDAGERVNQSNQRLAEHLRRVVDTRNATESRRVQALAQEIKHVASRLGRAVDPLLRTRHPFHDIEGAPAVELPLERPLFSPTERLPATERPRPATVSIDDAMLQVLYETFYIDDARLRDNIARALMSRPQITLTELVNSYPITQGMAEVIAYLQIAARDTKHTIYRGTSDEIAITTTSDDKRMVIVPRIIFRRMESPAMEEQPHV